MYANARLLMCVECDLGRERESVNGGCVEVDSAPFTYCFDLCSMDPNSVRYVLGSAKVIFGVCGTYSFLCSISPTSPLRRPSMSQQTAGPLAPRSPTDPGPNA